MICGDCWEPDWTPYPEATCEHTEQPAVGTWLHKDGTVCKQSAAPANNRLRSCKHQDGELFIQYGCCNFIAPGFTVTGSLPQECPNHTSRPKIHVPESHEPLEKPCGIHGNYPGGKALYEKGLQAGAIAANEARRDAGMSKRMANEAREGAQKPVSRAKPGYTAPDTSPRNRYNNYIREFTRTGDEKWLKFALEQVKDCPDDYLDRYWDPNPAEIPRMRAEQSRNLWLTGGALVASAGIGSVVATVSAWGATGGYEIALLVWMIVMTAVVAASFCIRKAHDAH